MLQLKFNPELTLTGFRTTRPLCLRWKWSLLYLSVSTRAVFGQFSGPYSPVRPAKIWSWFCCRTVLWFCVFWRTWWTAAFENSIKLQWSNLIYPGTLSRLVRYLYSNAKIVSNRVTAENLNCYLPRHKLYIYSCQLIINSIRGVVSWERLYTTTKVWHVKYFPRHSRKGSLHHWTFLMTN